MSFFFFFFKSIYHFLFFYFGKFFLFFLFSSLGPLCSEPHEFINVASRADHSNLPNTITPRKFHW